MRRTRFLASVVALAAAGAMWFGGSFLTGESLAFAAARRTVKSTAGRTTRARRASDPASGPRRTTDAARDGSKSEAAPPPTAADPGAALRDASSRQRDAVSEKSSTTKNPERAGTKSSPENVASSRSTAEAKPTDAASRTSDAHPSGAKAPAEAPPTTKPSADKGSPDLPAESADGARAALDPTSPSARRELAAVAGATVPPAAAARPVVVSLDGPVFDGGDVPRAAAVLERMKTAFARCASTENALTKNEASIDLRFLVRAPGRAEGVDVDKARGVSSDVVRCMTSVLARSYVGAPSEDPVGVAVTVRMRRPEAANN